MPDRLWPSSFNDRQDPWSLNRLMWVIYQVPRCDEDTSSVMTTAWCKLERYLAHRTSTDAVPRRLGDWERFGELWESHVIHYLVDILVAVYCEAEDAHVIIMAASPKLSLESIPAMYVLGLARAVLARPRLAALFRDAFNDGEAFVAMLDEARASPVFNVPHLRAFVYAERALLVDYLTRTLPAFGKAVPEGLGG